jgi:hypothetical protein
MAKNKTPRGKSPPASGGNPTAGAVAVVKQFLTHTIDQPDEEKAKALLTAECLAAGTFHMSPEVAGAKYTIAEPLVEGNQIWVPVEISGSGQTLTIPLAPVQENGQWKLDMTRTVQKMMGGMEAVVEQMAQTVGQAMEGVGQAIADGFQQLGSAAASGQESTPPIDPAALEQFKTDVLREAEKEIRDATDVNLPLEVDFASLLTAPDSDDNLRLLGVLKDRVFNNWSYWIREVNEKIPFQDRVKAIRLEGVGDPAQRVIFAEGARIIYRLCLAEENGFYEGEDLGGHLAGTAAGMAESAPPGDVLGRPSYRPAGEASQIAANYQEFVLPALTVRIAEMLGHELPIDIDWDLFSDPDDVGGLWLWGVNRVCGAIGLLMTVPENRATRDEWSGGLKSLHIVPMPYAEVKAVKMEGDALKLFIDPSAGEAGCFNEAEIADAISQALKLRLRPLIAELERYAKARETLLEEIFGRPIKFAFDFDTFSIHPEESKSIFALTLLREHGIDTLYYALTAVAEKNPNFKEQVPKRVAWLYLDCVPTPEDKGVHGEQTTIVNHVFLFEGYNGYLTQKELEARLPAIVAGMPDQNWETPAAPEPAPEPAAEPVAEPHVSYGVPEPESEPAAEDPEAQAYTNMRAQIQAVLPAYSNNLQLMVGQAIPLEIAWDTLGRQLVAPGQLLNAALTPLLGGLGMLGQDAVMREAIAKRIGKIVLQQAAAAADHGFSLKDRILTFAAVLSPTVPTMDAPTAAIVLRALLTPPAARSAVKKAAPRRKASAKLTPTKSASTKSSASKKPKLEKGASKKAAPKKSVPKKKRR